MEFHQVLGSPGALALSDLGIPEPDFDRDAIVPPEEIDLFVMPGVGFDPWGNRLGQGRGFFDQYLSRLPRPARKIGLAFDCQMVEQLPCGEADIPVDLVMTERTVYQVEECEWVSESVDQTHKLAGIVAGQIQPPAVLRLSGELGAGKTEWVRGFLGSLGWKGRVRSPTFALEHVYSFGERARVYHLDGYRLDAPSELDLDRLREIEEDPLSIILVEWPERFGEEFSPFSAHLYFEWTGENRRRIRYRAYETRNHLNLEPAKAG
jgi:tRNA threonylcarbamoyl adenosine modification protein YjeE